MFKSLVASAGFLLLAAAHAADAPPTQAPAQSVAVAASGAASGALVCHRETPTGSTISHKVCRTQEELDAEARMTEDARRRIQYEAGVAAQQRVHGQ